MKTLTERLMGDDKTLPQFFFTIRPNDSRIPVLLKSGYVRAESYDEAKQKIFDEFGNLTIGFSMIAVTRVPG